MFIYTIVNIGSEKLLKEEISIKYPHLKFAFSRPGYVTFKDTSESFTKDSELNLVFARSYGLSLGKVESDKLEEEIGKYNCVTHRFSLLNENVAGVEGVIGSDILDVIEVKENEFWLGIRKCRKFSWRVPGSNPRVVLPSNSPSRAYLKIAEAFIYTDFQCNGENVLELGSAPGGASLAMLERGLCVYGVDNAIMDEICLSNKNFHHIKEPMQKVQDSDIPRPCNILVSDVNVLPSLILSQLKRFMSLRPGIREVFYTLKIGDKISVKEVLTHIETFKSFGFHTVAATQLPSNKSEVLLYGRRDQSKSIS